MSEALTEVFHSFMFPFDQIPADREADPGQVSSPSQVMSHPAQLTDTDPHGSFSFLTVSLSLT